MRRIAIGLIIMAAMSAANRANAAEKVRMAYAVQVHTANMMALGDYGHKYEIELEPVPMRRYADIQLALMTNQVDVAAFGYGNLGLMEEQNYRDYRMVAGVFTGGYGITLANGVKADTWKALEGLRLGTAPNSLAELVFKSSASLGGADLTKIRMISFTTGGPPMLSALKAREIDGFISWEPNNAEAAVGKYGYYSPLDITASTRGINGVIAVNSAFLQSKRPAIVGFVRAVIDATNVLNADFERYTQLAVRNTGAAPEIVLQAIPRGNLDYRFYAKEAGILLQLFHEANITKTDTSLAVGRQFDYSVLMEATGQPKAELGGS